MDQGIKLTIAGHEYQLRAKSEEQERRMRIAAEQINSRIDSYNKSFPTASMEDKLVYVALNEATTKLTYFDRLKEVGDEINTCKADMERYLSGITEQ